ncbi:ATP-binding protein [Aquisalinus flavus]|uniref:Sensory/regulatory protein RpfC n=1 Tax=Aquisalinus flavus TaxID=1526572 RepID=A0A8J2V6Q1_9PROT|nr:ATP-binding protein [Aquisalinus flavus]MBD0425330.1 response regulator [Aquisalinus flavus]UNE49018.1 response regulator [Aquisalinus flavus]GGD16949.1 hypothetical protein GCM10011342_27130 [Aquisalinus flavus]
MPKTLFRNVGNAVRSASRHDDQSGSLRRTIILLVLAVAGAVLTSYLAVLFYSAFLWQSPPARIGQILLIAATSCFLTGLPLILYCGMIVRSLQKTRLELAAAAREAEQASIAKTAFLANMSHEIRTPLNGVLGMAQALQMSELAPESRDLVTIIEDSGSTLMTILNDILDLSKIEAGKLDIAPDRNSPAKTLTRVCRLFSDVAARKGIALHLDISESLPQEAMFDAVRVSQCLSNLVSNAIKFTATGSVTIRANAVPQDDSWLIDIAVIDTGIGIDTANMSRLFAAFEQADNSISRDYGGTGLGLAISRQLARMMGGDVSATSQPGAGSCFRLTFTAGRCETLKQPQADESGKAVASLAGRHILVADDIAVNRQILRLFLAPLGAAITECENGRDVLQALGAERFDLLLIDLHMPVMNGFDAIATLRSAHPDLGDLPILTLTADAMEDVSRRLDTLGVAGTILKPFNRDHLLAEISRVLQPAPDRESASSRAGMTQAAVLHG